MTQRIVPVILDVTDDDSVHRAASLPAMFRFLSTTPAWRSTRPS